MSKKVDWNRFKSPVLWAGLLALVIKIISEQLGVELDNNAVGEIVTWVTSVLIAVGIYNNPTDKRNW